MAQQEVDHQTLQVLHEYDRTEYNLIFIDPTTGRRLTTIGLPTTAMAELVMAIASNLQGLAT